MQIHKNGSNGHVIHKLHVNGRIYSAWIDLNGTLENCEGRASSAPLGSRMMSPPKNGPTWIAVQDATRKAVDLLA